MFRNQVCCVVCGKLCTSLGWLELSKSLDKFLCPAAWKTYRDAAIFLVAFHTDDGAYAVARVAHLSAKHRICIGAAFYGWPAKGACAAGGLGRRDGGFRFATHATQKFVSRVRIFWIGFITSLFADLCH